jgi:hypothetical protein
MKRSEVWFGIGLLRRDGLVQAILAEQEALNIKGDEVAGKRLKVGFFSGLLG